MIKMVGFDLDGTIANSLPFSLKAFKAAVEQYSTAPLTQDEIVRTFGLNEMGMIKKVIDHHHEEIFEQYCALYQVYHAECPAPFSGIREIIERLNSKGILVALVTGKARNTCMLTLEKFAMTDLFCDIETGAEDAPNKVALIGKLLQTHRIATDEFIYVGDALSDLTACEKVGVPCFSACWGDGASAIETLTARNPGRVLTRVAQLEDVLPV